MKDVPGSCTDNCFQAKTPLASCFTAIPKLSFSYEMNGIPGSPHLCSIALTVRMALTRLESFRTFCQICGIGSYFA